MTLKSKIATYVVGIGMALSVIGSAEAGGRTVVLTPHGQQAQNVRDGLGILRWAQGSRSGNDATVDQRGSKNAAGVSQRGNGNATTVIQRGSRNSAIVNQNGSNNVSAVFQVGRGRQFELNQTGNNKTAIVIQTGR